MAKKIVQPVLLCGGAGTRLWPVSRAMVGKPFTRFSGETSLFGATLGRIKDPEVFRAPIILCNQEHRFLVSEELRRQGFSDALTALEPVGRNTAPAIAVAALAAAERDPDALLLVLPSDHAITDGEAFVSGVQGASEAAGGGRLMTFGVKPDRPETGYGYIKCGEALAEGSPGYRVARFVEKPDQATAVSYLAEGSYLWNSGMFLFPAPRLLEEMERFTPEIMQAARAALAAARHDFDYLWLDSEAYDTAPDISIDYALMERTENAGVVPVDLGWTDVGSWDTLWQVSARDAAGNVSVGDVIAEDTSNSYLRSDSRLLATLGMNDVVVIAQRDAVLVCPRDRAQDVRAIVSRLAEAQRSEHVHHTQVLRPWGSFEALDLGPNFQVKRLILKPGASISLQRHRHRSEHWVVVAGTAEVTRDSEVFPLETGASTFIPVGTIHRLRNPGSEALHIVEVQCGGYLGEDDIERFEDNYGRQ